MFDSHPVTSNPSAGALFSAMAGDSGCFLRTPDVAMMFGGGEAVTAEMLPMAADRVLILFAARTSGASATVRMAGWDGAAELLDSAGDDKVIACLASLGFLKALGFDGLGEADLAGYYLPSELREIAQRAVDHAAAGKGGDIYRAAKGIEILCEVIRLRGAGELTGLGAGGALSMAESRKLGEARRLILERYCEKLTINSISRACGINRAKLTRGFRELFGSSVAEALAERRLAEARRLLVSTDKPVSSIGYETGYTNNASFARAFSRHFGVSPSECRTTRWSAAGAGVVA